MNRPVISLKKEDHEKSRALWEQVFPEDGRDFLDVYYEGKGADNEILVCKDSRQEICAMIHWNPVRCVFYGKPITADFLVAVATRPDMRRKGLMTGLMKEGLARREERKMPFVFLTPAKEAYYTPFGFVSAGKCMGIPMEPEENGEKKREERFLVRPLGKEDRAGAANSMNSWLADSGSLLYAMRDPVYLQRLQKELASEGGDLMGVFDGDRLLGTFCYTEAGGLEIREPLCGREEKEQLYDEIRCWTSEKNKEDKSRETVCISGCDPGMPGASPHSVTMIRVVSLEACVSLVKSRKRITRKILVEDPLIPANNGPFLLTLSAEGGSLKPLSRKEGCCPVRIEELTKAWFRNLFLNEAV